MDELYEFCARMLGDREAAARAAAQARQRDSADRVQELARAVAGCRRAAGPDDRLPSAAVHASGSNSAHSSDPEPGPEAPAGSQSGPTMAQAVAGELATASARLPQRQREALALRESLRLSYAELATAIGIEPVAVAPLLARARLRLQLELRGSGPTAGDCPERDRALRTIALRQDHETVPPADDDWLLEHLGHCVGCRQAHIAMLEASVRYRAWQVRPAPAAPDGNGGIWATSSDKR